MDDLIKLEAQYTEDLHRLVVETVTDCKQAGLVGSDTMAMVLNNMLSELAANCHANYITEDKFVLMVSQCLSRI